MPKQLQTFQQKQSLAITTGVYQSISILQMSNMELAAFAAKELDKNPFIEDESVTSEPKNKESVLKEKIASYTSNVGGGRIADRNSNQNFLENIASEKSLKEHITEQINISFDDHKEKMIAFFLLDSLLSSGYLNIKIDEAAAILLCDEELVLKVLKTLQSFDPLGVFARDLRECLLIQLNDNDNEDVDPALVTMVQNIDLIANGDLKKLSKLCNINIGNVGTLIRQIRLLNPKPANGFFVEPTRYKIPDVILTFLEDGTAKLETNPESMPRLRVNQEYFIKIKNGVSQKEEKQFIKTEIDAANIVVKSIEQRSSTILKVARVIFEEQIDFFTRGVMYLKPMNLNKVAEITDFNESTISRATANKYISTPTGIFELKYFFSSSLNTIRSSGDNSSSTKAKEIIKQMIMNEEPDNILSDDDIADQLAMFNISAARRTIAKYREELGIGTSATRKRERDISADE